MNGLFLPLAAKRRRSAGGGAPPPFSGIDITNPDLFPQDTPGKIAAFAYSYVWVEDFGGPSEFGYILLFQTDVLDDVRSITADQGLPTEAPLVEGNRGNDNAFWVYMSPGLTPGVDHIFTLSSPGLPTQTFKARVPAGGLKDLETRPSSACYFSNFATENPALHIGVAEPPGSSSGGIDLWAAEDLDGLNAMGALGVGAQRDHWPEGAGLNLDRPSDWSMFNSYWDGALWQPGRAPSLISGTHTLTISATGNDAGFVQGNYGAITPATLDGLTITEMREHWDFDDSTLFLTLGGLQIPGVTKVVFVQKSAGFPPVDLIWDAANSQYTATVSPAPVGGILINFSGQDVRIDLLPGPTLDEQVEAILAGTKGFALDPTDFSTLAQDIAGTIPVTAGGQPVGSIAGKWGTAPPVYQAGNDAGARPTLTAGGLTFDGVDDFLRVPAPIDTFRNVPGAGLTIHLEPGVTTSGVFAYFSQNVSSSERVGARIQSANIRNDRAPIDLGSNTRASPAGVVTPGTALVLTSVADFIVDRFLRTFINGVENGSGVAMLTAAGNSSDTTSAIAHIGRPSTNNSFYVGKLGRVVFYPFAPTPEQRAVLEAWVSEVPFDPAPPPALAPAWRMPEDFSTLPPDGGVVSHNGQNWRNISLTPNVWEPGIFGWEAVT